MSAQPHLEATYAGPDASDKSFSFPLPTLAASPSTSDRTAYLTALRSSVQSIQGQVNTFLTQKMGEEKANAAAGGNRVDDSKEEENYGEEVIDEDGQS
ncbi:hypothetical protein NA57DRAFT_48739 [Rhizodiscina lignyota]|uniref:EKC/KEOPS complex subunit GON7 n=1 Tax=Rhizodiscina lignyota TaxID=1504668 RepID=A0A9P4M154_9PEZI|nr:hypothetical protein NA57DRAFT_48739 [Rhizodiscina lignyota]